MATMMLPTFLQITAHIFIIGIVIANDYGEETLPPKRCEHVAVVSKTDATESFHIPWTDEASKCSYTILGDNTDCDVELSCHIDIPAHDGENGLDQNDEDYCSNGYLRVTDGSSGFLKFCGKTKFTQLSAGNGLRDLFLQLQRVERDNEKRNSRTNSYKGVKCKATCVNKKRKADNRLPANLKRKHDPRCVCGLANQGDRIVAGEDAVMAEFPWQAAIVYPESREPFCGGSVINDRWILTAAHCFWFEDKHPDDMDVLLHSLLLDQTIEEGANAKAELGEKGSLKSRGHNFQNKTDDDEHTQRYRIVEIINHPLFNAEYDYDFALLRVDRKINFFSRESEVAPVCLPPADTFDSLMESWEGQKMTVSGWGKAAANAGGTTRLLQKLQVPYVPFPKCKRQMSNLEVTNRMLCCGYDEGGKDACTGDSGGPLTISKTKGGKQMWQVGVVSWGDGCADVGRPGIYSRVTEALQWIHFHVSTGSNVVPKWCGGELKQRPED